MGFNTISSRDFLPCTSSGFVGTPLSEDRALVQALSLIDKAAFTATHQSERDRGQWRYSIIASDLDPRVDPHTHTIYVGSKLINKIGRKVPVTIIDGKHPEAILEQVSGEMRSVLIAGVQYFQAKTSFDEKDNRLAYVVEDLKKQGLMVAFTGIDKWFNGQPTEPTATLMCLAESVNKVYSLCDLCYPRLRNHGTYYWKFEGDTPVDHRSLRTIEPHEHFRALCLEHFIETTNEPQYETLKELTEGYKAITDRVPEFTAFSGPMYGGKSDSMISTVINMSGKLGCEYVFFKPKEDTRTPGKIVTRAGAFPGQQFGGEFDAIEIVNKDPEAGEYLTAEIAQAVIDKYDNKPVIVGFDEPWLLEESSLMRSIMELRLMGHPVIVGTLSSDFAKKGIGSTPAILSAANEVEVRSASCECNNLSNYTQRWVWDKAKKVYTTPSFNAPVVSIEKTKKQMENDVHADIYDTRCLFCLTVNDTPADWS